MTENKIIDLATTDQYTLVTFKVPSISNASAVDSISEILRPMVDSGQIQRLIVDFQGVRFFSSLVLGMLVDMWQRLNKAGGAVVISGIDPQLSRVFRITSLDKIFQFYPDTNAAIDAVKAM